MQKELQTWRNEASRWQQRLHGSGQAAGEASLNRAALDTLNDEIAKKQNSIKLLKRQAITNEKQLSDLLDVVIGGAA